MKRFIFILALMVSSNSFAQHAKPKIIVGLVVDQMRWDYLYRYQDRYSKDGFNRLIREGFSFENTQIPYVPTYTAVGHACIYTGSVPALNGMISNYWYDRGIGRGLYCVSDTAVTGVGYLNAAGQMSPRNLFSSTLGDQLKLSNNFRSKVIGISLKDRGAILPAGHAANAAYWYADGKWISSSYYMNELPGWVNDFNSRDMPAQLMKQNWNLLYPASTYVQSDSDANDYEGAIGGFTTNSFPYDFSKLGGRYKESIRTTPQGNTLTLEFAKQALINEKLGQGNITDMLAISLSSPDYIGHTFGPNSIEAEDAFLRLDKELAGFLRFLDEKVGRGNYLFFLSADHGAAHVPAFLKKHKIPAGTYSDAMFKDTLNRQLSAKYGKEKMVLSIENNQVYIDHNNLEDFENVKKDVISFLMQQPVVDAAFELKETGESALQAIVKERVINGFYPKRSGDIQFIVKPGYFDGGNKGTTHGMWNPYDSHIPLVFFGWNVPKGKSYEPVFMTDIAPTVCSMLSIEMPNASIGKSLQGLMQQGYKMPSSAKEK